MKWLYGVLAILLMLVVLGATGVPTPAAAQLPPAALTLEHTGPGLVVNGVLFEDALGYSPEEIVALINAARTSLDELIKAPEAVQARVNRVLTILSAVPLPPPEVTP